MQLFSKKNTKLFKIGSLHHFFAVYLAFFVIKKRQFTRFKKYAKKICLVRIASCDGNI